MYTLFYFYYSSNIIPQPNSTTFPFHIIDLTPQTHLMNPQIICQFEQQIRQILFQTTSNLHEAQIYHENFLIL